MIHRLELVCACVRALACARVCACVHAQLVARRWLTAGALVLLPLGALQTNHSHNQL